MNVSPPNTGMSIGMGQQSSKACHLIWSAFNGSDIRFSVYSISNRLNLEVDLQSL